MLVYEFARAGDPALEIAKPINDSSDVSGPVAHAQLV
jgi:hypothetical protein